MSTSEKQLSASLQQIEKHLADKNPALLQAFRLYHELDQVAYELSLINMNDSLASKTSWSPIITLIGDDNSGKDEFINRYLQPSTPILGTQNDTQFSVLIYRDDTNNMTLPGTAIEGDPRFPFFHIGEQLEQLEKNESRHINLYLELQTNNSPKLKDKTLINSPGFSKNEREQGINLLRNQASSLSDLIFVFFNAEHDLLKINNKNLTGFLEKAANSSNPNKFIYIIYQSQTLTTDINLDEWKQKLKTLGLHAGQFFILSQDPHSEDQQKIEQKLANIDIDSAYRILNTLEKHIHDIEDVSINEVKKAITLWKERTHFTLVSLLSIIALTIVAGEVQFGLLAILLDPFVASIFLFLLVTGSIPFHIYSSKIHAKFIAQKLEKRRQELSLMENLPTLFMKNLTLWRILFPIKEPLGWTADTQETLDMILTRAKGLVQSLNNSFNASSNPISTQKEETFLNL